MFVRAEISDYQQLRVSKLVLQYSYCIRVMIHHLTTRTHDVLYIKLL